MARYTISVRQVQQNVLPMTAAPGASTTCPGYTPGRMTTVFGYGQTFANGVNTHGWPARTIEAKVRGVAQIARASAEHTGLLSAFCCAGRCQ